MSLIFKVRNVETAFPSTPEKNNDNWLHDICRCFSFGQNKDE